MANLTEPLTIDDLEQYAATHLDKNAFGYFSSGADDDVTLHENRQAFRRIKLRPRMLRDVSHQDISVTVLGHKISMPICVSPTAYQAMAHPDGELATVRAVTTVNTAMGLSTCSTYSLEDVARESPDTVKFFQIPFLSDRQLMETLIKRAEKAGYKAVLLSVDMPRFSKHKERASFALPSHLKYANFLSFQKTKGFNNSQLDACLGTMIDSSVDWGAFDWLQSITSLPIIVKGILTAEDARLAVQRGAQGILVSNHGGRKLDGSQATIEVLPEIVKAVQGTGVEVYMDGGVRLGTDVLKTLALGARAVFVGRPVPWGLAYKGEQGVTAVLQILRDELKVAMALAGCATLKDISPSLVIRHAASQL